MENKFTNIKERTLQIAEYYKISKEKFFENLGISYGNFKGNAKNTPINSSFLENLLTCYPEVNPEWLLLGKGEMLRNGGVSGDNNVVGNTHCGSINTGTITSDSVQELIKQLDVKDSQLKEKDAQIARLLSILEKTSK